MAIPETSLRKRWRWCGGGGVEGLCMDKRSSKNRVIGFQMVRMSRHQDRVLESADFFEKNPTMDIVQLSVN